MEQRFPPSGKQKETVASIIAGQSFKDPSLRDKWLQASHQRRTILMVPAPESVKSTRMEN
jgi:hypothetical protein